MSEAHFVKKKDKFRENDQAKIASKFLCPYLPKELDLSKDIKVSDDFDSSLHELKFSCSECTARFSSEFPKSGYPSLFLADIVWPK